ncbi:hypothetical protein K443DRAFT_686440, partial [Laccaria amethystina LaAM-08-1]
MSSRERVARREAAAIADDQNMMLQVQNGVENDPAPKRARLSSRTRILIRPLPQKSALSFCEGGSHSKCQISEEKRKSQRTSLEKYKCDSKHSPIHGSSIV